MAMHKIINRRGCRKDILIRAKPVPKREWITMEIVRDIERRRLLKNKTN